MGRLHPLSCSRPSSARHCRSHGVFQEVLGGLLQKLNLADLKNPLSHYDLPTIALPRASMRQEKAKHVALSAWKRCPDQYEEIGRPNGNDALLSYLELEKRRDQALRCRCRGDNWETVHVWLLEAGSVKRLKGRTPCAGSVSGCS